MKVQAVYQALVSWQNLNFTLCLLSLGNCWNLRSDISIFQLLLTFRLLESPVCVGSGVMQEFREDLYADFGSPLHLWLPPILFYLFMHLCVYLFMYFSFLLTLLQMFLIFTPLCPPPIRPLPPSPPSGPQHIIVCVHGLCLHII